MRLLGISDTNRQAAPGHEGPAARLGNVRKPDYGVPTGETEARLAEVTLMKRIDGMLTVATWLGALGPSYLAGVLLREEARRRVLLGRGSRERGARRPDGIAGEPAGAQYREPSEHAGRQARRLPFATRP